MLRSVVQYLSNWYATRDGRVTLVGKARRRFDRPSVTTGSFFSDWAVGTPCGAAACAGKVPERTPRRSLACLRRNMVARGRRWHPRSFMPRRSTRQQEPGVRKRCGPAPGSFRQAGRARAAGAGFFGCFGFFCSLRCLSRFPIGGLLCWVIINADSVPRLRVTRTSARTRPRPSAINLRQASKYSVRRGDRR